LPVGISAFRKIKRLAAIDGRAEAGPRLALTFPGKRPPAVKTTPDT
jgi:hypothetical protein